MVTLVVGLCMEGLWRHWCFAVIDMRKLRTRYIRMRDFCDTGDYSMCQVIVRQLFGVTMYSSGH